MAMAKGAVLLTGAAERLSLWAITMAWDMEMDGHPDAAMRREMGLRRECMSETTANRKKWVKWLNYGNSGCGKTLLLGTLGRPLILNVENRLLSLQDADIPVLGIETIGQALEFFAAGRFPADGVALDSITELAELELTRELSTEKDGRKAYQKVGTAVQELLREINKAQTHVIVNAKLDRSVLPDGTVAMQPAMPGKAIAPWIESYFDVVTLTMSKVTPEGVKRCMLTALNGEVIAKDHTGRLASPYEYEPNLAQMLKKMTEPKKVSEA